jgi:hypothetical protein
LGANFANLPRILSVLCDVLHGDHHHMVKAPVRVRLISILNRLATLPPDALNALNASLSPVQRTTFANILAQSQAEAVAAATAAVASLSISGTPPASS